MFTYLQKQLIQLEQEKNGIQLLYEQLEGYLIEGKVRDEKVERNGTMYTITWDERSQKLCVHYTDRFNHKVKKCDQIQS